MSAGHDPSSQPESFTSTDRPAGKPGVPAGRSSSRAPIYLGLGALGLIVVLIAGVALTVVAGGHPSSSPSSPLLAASGTPSAIASASATSWPQPSCIGDRTRVDWFIGLGNGSQPNQLQVEMDFINKFNDRCGPPNIIIVPRIVPNTTAVDVLKTEIAAGKGPDIVGPIYIDSRAELPGVFLDLTGEVARNHTDLSLYGDKLLNSFKMGSDGLTGLPYLIDPGFIFYSKDLFANAGLPGLPTTVGATFNGEEWTWDTLAKYAKQLTIDTTGKKSTDAGFNYTKIQDYGFDTQWISDLRRFATPFGAGSYVAADGRTAQIPTVWAQAWKWYYDAMWTSHFAPTSPEAAAVAGTGNTIATGRVAMELAWPWSISSYGSTGTAGGAPTSKFKHWDMGVLPSHNGVTTSPVDEETFCILKAGKVPDAAYKAMLAIESDPGLMAVYGGMPAAPSLQAAYFEAAQAGVDAQFSDNPITWSVLVEMAKYAASPTHLDPMPNYAVVTQLDEALYARLQSKQGLDMDAAIAAFKKQLQTAFDAAPRSSASGSAAST